MYVWGDCKSQEELEEEYRRSRGAIMIDSNAERK